MRNKKIGIENFRVFKDYTEFEIRPLTLLTGPNNSGKSSFTKLILLLKNNFEQLNFEEGEHNLENFESILNWDSSTETLILRFDNHISFLPSDFYTEFNYTQGELTGVKIASSSTNLLEIKFSTDKSVIEYGSVGFLQSINFNIESFLNLLSTKSVLVKTIEEKPTSANSTNQIDKYLPIKELDISTEDSNIATSQINSHLEKIPFYEQHKSYSLRNSAILTFLNRLTSDSQIYEVLINGKNPEEENKEIIRNFQKKAFSEMHFSKNMGMSLKLKNFKINFDHLVDLIPTKAEKNLRKSLDDYYGQNKTEIKYTPLYHFLFTDKVFLDGFEKFSQNPFVDQFDEKFQFHQTWFEQFKDVPFDLLNLVGDFSFISPNRGKQQRVLMNNSDNEIDAIVLQFSKLPKSIQNLPFLKEALTILGIEGELDIKRFENFISVISLKKEQKNITLADLGYGYSQIIPILLKIVLVNQGLNPKSNLIIEEPEANLHPDLQSKLADIISLSLNEYPGSNFIIETHSEYLIRKLQYLTAKKELQPEQSVIYYFNADHYVSKEEPKVKKIEITLTGNLTDTFGPGFYDEATRLKFDLMKINKEQNN